MSRYIDVCRSLGAVAVYSHDGPSARRLRKMIYAMARRGAHCLAFIRDGHLYAVQADGRVAQDVRPEWIVGTYAPGVTLGELADDILQWRSA